MKVMKIIASLIILSVMLYEIGTLFMLILHSVFIERKYKMGIIVLAFISLLFLVVTS